MEVASDFSDHDEGSRSFSVMAKEHPDPKTFGSWEEAFKFPVPTVRRMERQLRGDVASNQERLRTVVGYGSSNDRSFR